MLGVLAVYFAAAAGMGGLELDLSGIEGLADAAPVALPPPPPLPPPEADECALWGGAVGGAAVAAGAGSGGESGPIFSVRWRFRPAGIGANSIWTAISCIYLTVRWHFRPTGRGTNSIWTASSCIYLAPNCILARQAEGKVTFGLPTHVDI